MLKLSIITVNLNNADGLRKTIDSVINQAYTNFEHIIIDGGSTDESVEVIKEYEALYKEKQRHLYWVSEPDKGIYNGMNKGIKVAKGEYCQFLNSGDELVKSTILEKVTNDNNDKDILYGNIINKKETKILNEVKYPKSISLVLLAKGALGHPAMFIKKELFDKFGYYNENYKIVSDWEFYSKSFLKHNCSYYHLNYPISYFDIDGISNNSLNNNVIKDEMFAAKLSIFPQVVWDTASQLHTAENKLNGLLSSGTVKIALKLSRLINLFKK